MALTAGATLALMCIQGAHMQFGPAQTKMAAFVQVCGYAAPLCGLWLLFVEAAMHVHVHAHACHAVLVGGMLVCAGVN